MFIVHGNVYDLHRSGPEPSAPYLPLDEFLATQLFGRWDIVLHYDLGRGLRALAPGASDRHRRMNAHLTRWFGDPSAWPRDPKGALALVDALINRVLITEKAAERPSVAVLVDYAHYLAPDAGPAQLSSAAATNLAVFQNWARSPYLKRVNVAFCLIAETLTELNIRLVRNPHTAEFEVPYPDERQRREFLAALRGGTAAPTLRKGPPDAATATGADDVAAETHREAGSGLSDDTVARHTAGLTLLSLQAIGKRAAGRGGNIDAALLRRYKKELIEGQCGGLLEFVEPDFTLEMLVGHEAVKAQLRADAALLAQGHLDAVPMGYLVCGPVGTGKSFLAECFAGTVGVPAVKLRNFRSKYVGETEGNLEQVLTVLRSLGPVVVIIDEADAALGSRDASGDSGTSARVFAQIAAQMGDTRYRGRIVWMLLTCRPDLLPIDLKRPGRAEIHLPLLPPDSPEEIAAMFVAMGRKNGIALDPAGAAGVSPKRGLTGADIEAIVLGAHRRALLGGTGDLRADELAASAEGFVPSADSLEKELQWTAAVLETADVALLPEPLRAQVLDPVRRSALAGRLEELRRTISAT